MLTILFLVWLALTTPCPTEDSTNCYWDAQTQGNGRGTSSLRIDFTP
jgi:hypothetical protein